MGSKQLLSHNHSTKPVNGTELAVLIVPFVCFGHNLLWMIYFLYRYACRHNSILNANLKRGTIAVFVTNTIMALYIAISTLPNISISCKLGIIAYLSVFCCTKLSLFIFFTLRVDVIFRDSFFHYSRPLMWALRSVVLFCTVTYLTVFSLRCDGYRATADDYCNLSSDPFWLPYVSVILDAVSNSILVAIFTRKIYQVTHSNTLQSIAKQETFTLSNRVPTAFARATTARQIRLVRSLFHHTLIILFTAFVSAMLLFIGDILQSLAILLSISSCLNIWSLWLIFRPTLFNKYCHCCVVVTKPCCLCFMGDFDSIFISHSDVRSGAKHYRNFTNHTSVQHSNMYSLPIHATDGDLLMQSLGLNTTLTTITAGGEHCRVPSSSELEAMDSAKRQLNAFGQPLHPELFDAKKYDINEMNHYNTHYNAFNQYPIGNGSGNANANGNPQSPSSRDQTIDWSTQLVHQPSVPKSSRGIGGVIPTQASVPIYHQTNYRDSLSESSMSSESALSSALGAAYNNQFGNYVDPSGKYKLWGFKGHAVRATPSPPPPTDIQHCEANQRRSAAVVAGRGNAANGQSSHLQSSHHLHSHLRSQTVSQQSHPYQMRGKSGKSMSKVSLPLRDVSMESGRTRQGTTFASLVGTPLIEKAASLRRALGGLSTKRKKPQSSYEVPLLLTDQS